MVFAGGEPTGQAALACAVDEVRAAGLAVGLHTAGACPSRLAGLLPQLDWVGLDIKALPEQYGAVTGVAASGVRAFQALELVVASGVDHEVRVTIDPAVHTDRAIRRLIALVQARGAGRIVRQQLRRPDGSVAPALPVQSEPPVGVQHRAAAP